MLTIFCSPKPFTGVSEWNQLNAMRSWRAIHPDVEIIVFGASVGEAEATTEVNAILVPEIECGPGGGPSFNAMAKYVRQHGKYDKQMYVNADIILDASSLDAFETVFNRFDNFLIIGERMDLSKDIKIDVRQSDWIDDVVTKYQSGQLSAHGHTGIDYFGFSRGMWHDLPPVFMGRALCDMALLHYCFKRHIPVLDATLAIVAIHQFHDYKHLPGGKQQVFQGEDRANMSKSHGLYHSLPTIADADFRLVENGTIVSDSPRHGFLRRLEQIINYRFRLRYLALGVRAIQRFRGKKGVLAKMLNVDRILRAWIPNGTEVFHKSDD